MILKKKLKEELLEDSDFFQLVNKSEFKILMNKRKLKTVKINLFSLINVKYFIDGQMNTNIKYCIKCLLPNTRPEIIIGDDGSQMFGNKMKKSNLMLIGI